MDEPSPGQSAEEAASSGAAEDEKARLRSRLLTARAAVPAPARAAAAAQIRERLEALPELLHARAVLGYAAFGSEVSIDAFLHGLLERELGVFLPFVDADHLGLARVRDLEADLAPGWRGVREPRAGGRKAGRAERLDAAVVPGVGFDDRGGRLGYGGGHFDRLLARLRPGTPVIGVALDVQVVAAVPLEPHDRRVDILVTETRTIRARV